MYNPSLRQEPRYEPAAVIPLNKDASLIDWLKVNNRLIARESIDVEIPPQEETEITDLIEVDDPGFDDDDDLVLDDD
jgi:hypothetical protein